MVIMGRSVAWGAQLLGIDCHIFIHKQVSQERADVMASFGAVIHRINGNYDDSIVACSDMARENQWQIISDTSWEGYMEIPLHVMAGYSVMTKEIIEQMQGEKPTSYYYTSWLRWYGRWYFSKFMALLARQHASNYYCGIVHV